MTVFRPTILLIAAFASFVACARPTEEKPATWRADCAPLVRPAPLGLDAARAAYLSSERRHELRLREAAAPGSFLRELHRATDASRLAAGDLCPDDLADLGALLFEYEYGLADGLAGAPAERRRSGPFRRVHGGLFGGPETISCPSCHWVGGPAGAGAETDNAFLRGDGDRPGSGAERNPPALLGVGVVQALAREMTRDLRAQREAVQLAAAREGGAQEIRLRSKGVEFGVLRVSAEGELDVSGIRGVDADLIVKPFGWEGKLADFTDFAAEALQVHLGMQSERLLARGYPELVGDGADPEDPDGDGVRREIGDGPLAALGVHLGLLEMPIVEPLVQDREMEPAAEGLLPPTTTSFVDDFWRGRRQFHALGCASCHVPRMVLESPVLTLEGLPPIDLAREMRQPGLRYDPSLGGYPVWLFSDLKRHDMGPGPDTGTEYLTPRLWGVADSAPYLHDGRAPSLDYAIAGHGGEGAAARAAYAASSHEEKGALRVYLMSLRRASRVIVP